MRSFALALLVLLVACSTASPAAKHTATLHWIASTSVNVRAYYVYRDSVRVSSKVTQLGYVDRLQSSGSHSYYVTAWSAKGESGPSNVVTIFVK